jgi:transposase
MVVALRSYTIQDQRRAVNVYVGGLSVERTAKTIEVPFGTVRRWIQESGRMRTRGASHQIRDVGAHWTTLPVLDAIRRWRSEGVPNVEIAKRIRREFGVAVTVRMVRSAVARNGIAAPRGHAQLVANDTPHSHEGRARLQRIRDVVRMRHEGMRNRDVGRAMGIAESHAHALYKTPYAAALREFVHGTGQAPKKPHALAMHERQGLPAWFIAKVLDVKVRTVENWLAAADRHRASKRASEQRRRDRATALLIDAHRDADTHPQPE